MTRKPVGRTLVRDFDDENTEPWNATERPCSRSDHHRGAQSIRNIPVDEEVPV